MHLCCRVPQALVDHGPGALEWSCEQSLSPANLGIQLVQPSPAYQELPREGRSGVLRERRPLLAGVGGQRLTTGQ